jgi:hypothetical protein
MGSLLDSVRHGENEVRLQALHRAPPHAPAADSVGCEEGLCEIKWDYHIVGTRASDGSGRSPPQTRPQK